MIGHPRLLTLACLAAFFLASPLFGQQQNEPRNHVVELSATADSSGVHLRWRGNSDATGYIIYRRSHPNDGWTEVARLGGSSTSWDDSSAGTGTAYEYRVEKTTGTYKGVGFISAGSDVPSVHSRGRIILVIDSRFEGALSSELQRLRNDLLGDGWITRSITVNSSDAPASVRDRIRAIWDQDRANTKAVFLFGRVPVPYSGNIAPDGHDNHRGAWPADLFYGEMDGSWTDHEVNSTTAERQINHNVPGDGKFDQGKIPGRVELAVGRVDFFEMTCYANKNPSRSELDLLRAYLGKNHEFRHGRVQVNRRGYILDNFGMRGTNAVSANGWRNFSGFVGYENVSQLALDTYFPTLENNSALATWGAGGGSYYYSSGIGTSDDFALRNPKVVFTLWLGSYFGDWNNESNFLRAALGSGHILVSIYSGLPHTFLHRMSLGETIGEGILISQNNTTNDGYFPDDQGVGEVHIGLHGDPSLRLHPVIPPSNLQAASGASVRLTWNASTDNSIQGYHIYRATSGDENFTRLTAAPADATAFDDSALSGNYTYMVRALKREQSGSGTYFNLSQGAFVNATSTGSAPTPPNAPTTLTATTQSHNAISLAWTDASNDETHFKLERRLTSGSEFQEITTLSANTTAYNDTSVIPATTYRYRVRAANAAGDSPYSNEVEAQTSEPPVPAATVTDLGTKTNIAGNWPVAYGAEGFAIPGSATDLPAKLAFQLTAASEHIWQNPATDTRAVFLLPADTTRIASAWYHMTTLQADLTASAATDIALYFLDWDRQNRIQELTILDKETGAPLMQKRVENFGDGLHVEFRLQGAVTIRLNRIAGPNTLLTALFAGGSAKPPISQPTLTLLRNENTVTLRCAAPIGSRIHLQTSPDLATWDDHSEHNITNSPTDVPIIVNGTNTYFRLRLN